MSKKLITNYKFVPGYLPPSTNLYSQTYNLLYENRKFIIEEVTAYINYNTVNNIAPFAYYNYNADKCRRDMSYVLDAYLSDLRHGGNRQTVFVGSKYYLNGVLQISASAPEVAAHTFLKTLVDNFVLQNVRYSSIQSIAVQTIDQTYTPESAGVTALNALIQIIINVLAPNGNLTLPAVTNNRGYIKFIGYYQLKDILLITNTTRNVVLYSFADASNQAEATYNAAANTDPDFPGAVFGNDTITTVTFDIDTSQMLVTDTIQIFVEGKEQAVRLNPIGTDAMERMKVGLPQSMIDADFEYGLQPTKWQAISLMRNYPAQYEIPGTDQSVISVYSDASAGTGYIGASQITVTTVASHGFSVGTIFTIKALASSVLGFSRAEGTFVVASIPAQNVFTFYAKSKVGTVNPTLLSSAYTQLRTANFYTGASVGQPTFNVYSNGSTGTITTSLVTASGSNYLGFTGAIPPLSAPLTGTGINTGTQITGVIGTGGTAAATTLTTTSTIGDTFYIVNSTVGIIPGLVVDRGDGQAVQVTSINGNTVTLSGALTSSTLGTSQTYNNVAQYSTSGIGTGATFNISRTTGSYTVSAGSNAGVGYAAGDTIIILGTTLSGATTLNDATITVSAASPINAVDTFDVTTLSPGDSYPAIQTTNLATTCSGPGTGLTVNVQINPTAGTITAVTVSNAGSGYTSGSTVTILGTSGTQATINIASIQAGGVILGQTISGTPLTTNAVNFISALTLSDVTTGPIASGSTGISYTSISTIEVTFLTAHGFVPGDTITVTISSAGTNSQYAAGAYFVESTPLPTTIRYTARAPGNIQNTLTGNIYARPDCFYIHRPLDGGVQLGTGGSAHGAQAIRMSKKYLRYQSGKGIMYNTGALFAPSYDIQNITSNGTAIGSTITMTNDDTDHGCQVGAVITISGVATSGYNGTYTVSAIINERVLQFQATQLLGSATPSLGDPCQMAILNWHGATIRSGTFDDQNGMFWQYDGIRMALVKRASVFHLAGTINATPDSNSITGTNTRFTTQLQVGDRCVIRGMSHVITSITSDTQMTVAPDYRGTVAITNSKITKTIDLVVPQEQWNVDTLNGQGPSGYTLDVTKMQMIGMQWTWYGAGFIDFMLRGSDGNYTFAHRFRNSNNNSEAYMRTGNMPVRYEVINEGARSKTTAAIDAVTTTIPLTSAFYFPSKGGTVMIDNELIRYTSVQGNNLLGCVRGTTLAQFVSGSNRTFSAGAAATHVLGSGAVLVSNTITPNISHWGSAFLLDGQFTTDRGYIYSYAATGVQCGLTNNTAFLMRLSPSVSNAQTGDLGERELLNRAQLLLSGISITSDAVSGGGAIVVTGVMNPVNYPTDPTKITWTGITSSAAGGQPSFVQIANGGSVSWAGGVSQTNATVYGAYTSSLPATSFSPSGASINAIGLAAVNQTLTAASFGYNTANGSALGFNVNTPFTGVNQTLTAQGFTTIDPYGGTTYLSATSTARTDFLVTNTQYDAIQAGATPIKLGDTLTSANLAAGTYITGVTRAYNAGVYTRIIMNQVASVTSPAGAINPVSITTSTGSRYNSAVSIYRTDILLTNAQFSGFTLTPIVGNTITGTNIPINTTIASITPSYLGTTYTQIVLSATPTGTSTPGNGQNVSVQIQTAYNTTYFSALSASRNDFLVAQSAITALTTPIAVGDTLFATTYITGGQTVSNITQNYITIGGVAYARIVMNGVASATSSSATTNGQYNITVTLGSSVANNYNVAVSTSRNDFLITQTQYSGITLAVTDVLSAATYITGSQTVSSITQNYTTIAGTSYARIVMSSVGNASSTGGSNVGISTTSAATAIYGSALSTTRADFLVPDAVWSIAGMSAGDTLSVATYITGGQSILSTTSSYLTIGGTAYTRVIMSANANATSTTGGGNNVTVVVTAAGTGATYVNKNYLFFDSTTWLASGATNGTYLAVTYTQFPSGAAVNGISTRQFYPTASTISSASGNGTQVTYTLSGTNTYPAGMQVTVTGITGGTGMNGTFTVVSSTAGTLVVTSAGSGTPSSYSGASVAGAVVYRITFTQSANTTISAGATPTFQFGAAYALPGETVFSFVSNPGNTDTLDLSALKELTSSAIGGRGTFPNGPDVLAINIYKVSGSNTNANVILRWAEAQA